MGLIDYVCDSGVQFEAGSASFTAPPVLKIRHLVQMNNDARALALAAEISAAPVGQQDFGFRNFRSKCPAGR
jgi:hypothetical protein